MSNLFPYPFVRLIIPLLAGIIAGAYSDLLYAHLFVPVVLLWLCLLSAVIYPKIFALPGNRYYYLICSLFIIFLLGYFLSNRHIINLNQQADNANGDIFLLKVTSMPVEKNKSVKVTGNVFSIDNNLKKHLSFCGKGLFYFEKDSLALQICYGDQLLLRKHLLMAENNGNPGEFDYRTYLNRKGIIWNGFIAQGNWWLLEKNSGAVLKGALISYRNRIILELQSAGLKEKEFSVATAMLLGYNEILDRQTRQAFSDAGAMHILCVSGLHVGIIYLVLNFLLSFLKKIRYGRILQIFLMIILIWLYAGLTGMQTPVLRASIMFSFLAVGKLINRQAYIYNTLAASAFFILLFEPMALFSAGFQLSYTAVIFIVWLYNPLYRIFPFNSGITGKIWSLICVSIAATTGTLPLVLHYFNQFPLYFILTNLLVVPLSFLIVGSGIIFMLFPFFTPLTYLIHKLLNIFLLLLNSIVSLIQNLPDAGINELYLNLYETVLLFLLIIFLAAVFVSGKSYMLKYSLLILLLLTFSFYYSSYIQKQEKKVIIYNITKGTAIDLIAGRKYYFIADSVVLKDKNLLDYNTKGNRIKNRLSSAGDFCPDKTGLETVDEGLSISRNVIVFNNYKVIIIDNETNIESFGNIFFDAALFKPGIRINADDLSQKLNCPLWITDPSMTHYEIEKLKTLAKTAGVDLYEIKKCGAFIHEL